MVRTTRHDARLPVFDAKVLMSGLELKRCTGCGASELAPRRDRHDCGARWRVISRPLEREVLLRFMSRQMLRLDVLATQ